MEKLDTDATVQRCRELATECLTLLQVMDAEDKPVLVELAEHWAKLGEKAARGEKLDEEISLAPIAEQLKRGFNSPVHRNLRASEGVKNLLR
jgi:hypothetical protein